MTKAGSIERMELLNKLIQSTKKGRVPEFSDVLKIAGIEDERESVEALVDYIAPKTNRYGVDKDDCNCKGDR